MTPARIRVDFNEMLEPDLVLLSRADSCTDSNGTTIELSEGLDVQLYEVDLGEDGRPDCLIADGTVEQNRSGVAWARQAKWCCRIDGNGIRHQSGS